MELIKLDFHNGNRLFQRVYVREENLIEIQYFKGKKPCARAKVKTMQWDGTEKIECYDLTAECLKNIEDMYIRHFYEQ